MENPLALVLTGHRAATVALEEAWWRYDVAGLQCRADEPPTDPVAAPGALADCAEVELTGYNDDNNPTPARGTSTD